MHTYAQTSVQLFNQLRREGYSTGDVEYFVTAYGPFPRLRQNLHRALGPHCEHSGIATRACDDGGGRGLLHAAYAQGDFETWGRGISGRKREQVKRIASTQAEVSTLIRN